MTAVREALWRVEFRTDLTQGAAPVIPVGFLLEAHWKGHARWLGLVFRRKLTRLELDSVNVLTWPEMSNLEPFMTNLFGEAWGFPGSDSSSALGSEGLAARFSPFNALQFVREETPVEAGHFDPVQSFASLYGKLLGFRARLHPILTAPIVPLRRKAKEHDDVDVEVLNKAA